MDFEILIHEMARPVIDYAAEQNRVLDYTAQSIEVLDEIMEIFHEKIDQHSDGNFLENWSYHCGAYIGETLLRVHLAEKGFAWYQDGAEPLLQRGGDRLYPFTKAYNRILFGCEDDIGTFYQMAVWIADQVPFSAERVVDVELVESEYHHANVLYENIEQYMLSVINGEEQYMILRSSDGYLQFFGMNDQFVMDSRINLPDGDFRTYAIINKEREQNFDNITVHSMLKTNKIPAREVISLEMLRAAVRAYYSNSQYESFLKKIPHVDTTEQTKRYMGLIK